MDLIYNVRSAFQQSFVHWLDLQPPKSPALNIAMFLNDHRVSRIYLWNLMKSYEHGHFMSFSMYHRFLQKKIGSRTWHHPTAPASFPFAGTTFAQVPAGDGVGQDLQMALQGQLGEVARHDVQHLKTSVLDHEKKTEAKIENHPHKEVFSMRKCWEKIENQAIWNENIMVRRRKDGNRMGKILRYNGKRWKTKQYMVLQCYLYHVLFRSHIV